MKLFKQPWFLIFILVLSVYTYRFYESPANLKISLNKAEANEAKDSKKPADEAKPKIKPNISESFATDKLKSFNIETPHSMKLKFEKAAGDKLVVLLTGEGDMYRNNGETLADWFDVNTKGGELQLHSPSNYGKWNPFKKKLIGASGENSLVMTVQVPEGFKFKDLDLELISADVVAENIKFENLSVENVSGDVTLQKSEGESIDIKTVSGDNVLEVAGLKKGVFKSVSGDARLTASGDVSKIKFESVSGDLDLQLPKDSDLDVHFESLSGELKNEFGMSKKSLSSLDFSSLSGSAKVSKIK